MTTRYIYLRSTQNDVAGGVYAQANLPVGCLAYRDLGDDRFAFGLAFLNSTVDSIDKSHARSVAHDRLNLAIAREDRKNNQGRFGIHTVDGRSLREKIANLVYKVTQGSLHGQPSIRQRVVDQLNDLEIRLLKHKEDGTD